MAWSGGKQGVLLWVMRVLVALMFSVPALFKLAGDAQWIAEFERIGWGIGFMYLVAAVELTGAALVLWPRTTVAGVLTLLAVDVGALVAQVAYFGHYPHLVIWFAVPLSLLILARR